MKCFSLFVLAGLGIALTANSTFAADPFACVKQDEYNPPVVCCEPLEVDKWQSFTPASSYRLQRVSLLLRTVYSPPLSDTMDLYITAGPDPNAEVLTHVTIPTKVFGLNWCDFDLPNVDLYAGATYFIRLHALTAAWEYNDPGDYAGGQGYRSGQATTGDFVFRTCGQSLDGDCAREVDNLYGYGVGKISLGFNPSQAFTPVEDMQLTTVDVDLEATMDGPATLKLQDGPSLSANVYSQVSRTVYGGVQEWTEFDLPNFDLAAEHTYFLQLTSTDSEISWLFSTSGQLFRVCGRLIRPVSVDPPRLEGTTFVTVAGPNPARGATAIRYGLAKPGDASLGVYDVSGRLVRRLHSGAQSAGASTVPWDLHSDRGAPVGPGVYFIALRAASSRRSTTVVIVN
jgi:hypothetical protein